MNVIVTDSRHDRVELYYVSHQSGCGGGRKNNNDASCLSHSDGGGTDSRDRKNAAKQLKEAY